MKAPAIARLLGVAFLFAGALGLAPFATPPAPLTAEYINLDANYGMLFGVFPVNAALDVLYIILGGLGVIASFDFKRAVIYLRVTTILCLVLVVLGTIPITNTLFGAVPIYGYDVLLHLVAMLFAAWGGFLAGSVGEPNPEDFVSG